MSSLVLDPAIVTLPDTSSLVEPQAGANTPRQRDHRSAALSEQLATAIARHDVDAERRVRDELTEVNMPIAEALAKRYRNRGESDDDLRQVAYLGLVQAARRYDPQRETSFAGFCVPTVLGEIKRHFRDRGWMVRPHRRVQELRLRVSRIRGELTVALGRPPTLAELAEHASCGQADVAEVLAAHSCYCPTPLDRLAGDDSESQTVGDLLPAHDDETGPVEARVVLADAVARLGERDRRILQLRFFDDLTQREIARDIGVTQMHVSRVLTRIRAELRDAIGDL